MTDTSWRDTAKDLFEQGKGIRETSRLCGKAYSTVRDYLVSQRLQSPVELGTSNIVKVETDKTAEGPTIIMIPDTQCKPGLDLSYLEWIGKYIASKKPDVIVHIGDHADMESLSSYDKGKKSAEGKRVSLDIEAAIEGMNTLLAPIAQEQARDKSWKPRMVLTLGNHCERIKRHVESNPELEGFLSYDSLRYKEMGWEVYDYLEPVTIGGVMFIHYFPNPMSGKPLGGSAASILKTVGASIVQGHKQTLDVATRTLYNGKTQWSIIAGACYAHEESYKGYVGNKHWKGLVVMHNVNEGSFDPLFVSIDYLKERFN